MDRNSITGLLLITLILIGFWFINKPSQEQVEAMRQQRDSLRMVEMLEEERRLSEEVRKEAEATPVSLTDETVTITENDTVQQQRARQMYGQLSPFVSGEQEFFTLENEKIIMTFTNKGGRIYSVELKDYKTHEGEPLILFEGENNKFGFSFTHNTRVFNTNDLYFDVQSHSDSIIVFQIATEQNESLRFRYTLPEDEYMTGFAIQTQNLRNLMATPRGTIDINWHVEMPAFELNRTQEQPNTRLYYKYHLSDVDNLRPGRNDSESIRTPLKWIAFKSQFFSSIFIAEETFTGAYLSAVQEENEYSTFLSYKTAEALVPVDFSLNQEHRFNFYFGPNHYYTLNSYGKDLEFNRLLPLGWGIFGWINRFAVIPVFNLLENRIASYGIIILILTLLIKLVLFPLTYKSYISTAKMKVLKPQIDEINERIPKDKALERQQAVMGLYKKAGVNPMGGCLPMLLQMPILIALFRFFPASIELRQEAFLWANDLSTYDSIIDLPFNIPFYGAHVSLFTLLMAITNIVYTKMNMEMTQSTNQMPGMKGMMYMMPVMFLFFFNSYSSGLSYYYFISTLITIFQTIIIKQFVDEKKLLKKIQANQKKPVKKSKFAQRLEDMAKQQQQIKKKGKR
ncbi:membrane protein insertase YidC [Alkalitalea saponilacus]|uniref:Membrane protein insertase YidC n=1 Tax=Alkalitalea saponilacus TaxID=889453 RepID=A0A1T5HRT8_9BACT|nr:membrane protein insertase YidC [Alkalitalea saponilacus]ASB50060.1 membrane protein insertase YidC [Alkalitalea saponilacus]SKC23424.1 YidC/Oxa1 family membrane protein insertase [Alkalitalea saponilacus]